jgi:hypothetical protein
VFLESRKIDHAFGENSVDERTRAAQQLSGRFHFWWRRTGWRGVYCGLRFPNLCALFVKLVSGQVGEPTASVCHQRELDAEREVAERLKLMVAGWYDLLTLFPALAKEHRIVTDQDSHRNIVAELRQNLLDEPRVGFMEANINCGKRFVRRREIPCRGELTLRVWVRQVHRVLTRWQSAISVSQILKLDRIATGYNWRKQLEAKSPRGDFASQTDDQPRAQLFIPHR